MGQASLAFIPACLGCAHCGIEPDDDYAHCGHPQTVKVSSSFGLYVHRARERGKPCGPDGVLFEQHPRRTPEGALK